ncbi:MAG: membrane protein insertase YidC [Bacteroidota bacterium]|nr:membrane protein insertase YidC [Bacteroidota bacterium]
MDRQAIIGFIIIAILFVAWMFYTAPSPEEIQKQQAAEQQSIEQQKQEQSREDAVLEGATADAVSENNTADAIDTAAGDSSAAAAGALRYGKWFSHLGEGNDYSFTVKTDKFDVEFSSQGGSIKRWTLNNFNTWRGNPLQLIDWTRQSDYNVVFASSDGRFIDTKDLYFRYSRYPEGGTVTLSDSMSYTVEAVLPVRGDSIALVKRYVVRNGSYNVDMDVEMINMSEVVANYEYQVTIHSPAHSERNSVEEASFSEANAYVDNNRNSFNADDAEERLKENLQGETEWISINNKYFLSALITRDDFTGSGAYVEGIMVPQPNEGQREIYEAGIKVKYRGKNLEVSKFTIFIGPMDYDLLKAQHEGLEQILSLGWEFVVRPFSEYFVMPLFGFLHSFIPNYGIVIIIFSIIVKLVLYPLTKSSMRSMQKMQKLQPMITEMREKYKDDQQRQNTEMMKLYKEYGVNPAGGCLPMALQMPILFALFTIFRSTIELRHEPFMLWITDLSAPDILIDLPMKIPVLGMSFISGLALMMAATMFVQQKMSVKDPRQKTMIYIMPVMFWILFNSFPSGLNLYYFMFNILSIGQQYLINKRHADEPLTKVTPKGGKKKAGWTERTMASMQEKAKEQEKMRKASKKKKF